MRLDTAEKRLAARWYPKGSLIINHPDGLGVAYVSPMERPIAANRDAWQVVAYRGTAGHPSFNNWFRSRAQAEEHVAKWFDSLGAHKQYVANSREERNKPHTLKVGDIITNSWGYDQTNVDCYQITRTTEHFVWLRPIASELVPDEGVGPMSGRVKPIAGKFLDKPEEQHKASGEHVCFEFGSGSKWAGESLYCSWYA